MKKIINLNKGRFKFAGLTLSVISAFALTQPVHAEGSRSLYPSSASGFRANLEWRTSTYGSGSTSLKRRTLLQVYVQKDEYILLGSSAVGVSDGGTSGDISVYSASKVSGRVGNENISGSADFTCSAQRTSTLNTNQGRITNRNQELAGPDTITNATNATPGGQVTNGYVPCYYQAPSAGIYYIAFYGPSGGNSNNEGTIAADVNLSATGNFDSSQKTSVAAWDVTVRNSLTSTADIKGRLFADYLALFTGSNNRPLNSTFYIATRDGYKYRTEFNGLDPNGFVIYGNDVGFYDSDGKTPLYHNILGNSGTAGADGNLTVLQGGTSLALPTHLVFFNDPNANNPEANKAISARGYQTVPTRPSVSNGNFTGTAGGNTSNLNTGGTFTFNSGTPGSYEILISRNGTDFDPSLPQNKVIRGTMISGGAQSVTWDGRDNSGNFFPAGKNYQVQIRVRNGEYHFPLIDAENSTRGGPSFTLLNEINPYGQSTGYYDDRGYRTLSGVNVGTPGTVLCGKNPPTIPFSNYLTGFNTTSNQRAFGTAIPGDNTNTSCTGSFGDAKGLDIWTYISSQEVITAFNIALSPVTADKTVALVGDNDKSSSITPGDTLEYTIVVANTGTNVTAPNVVLRDTIPTNTTYVNNSLQISAGDNSGVKTDGLNDDQGEINGSQVVFRLGSGANETTGGTMAPGESTTLKFQVKINDPLPAGVITVSNQAIISSNNFADVQTNDPSTTTPEDPTVTKIAPRLRLVKRVTGIKKFGSSTVTAITGYNNGSTDVNDDSSVAWTPDANTYLKGAITNADIPASPGAPASKDEVEYTIYYLADGGIPAQTVNICDFVPANQTFVSGSMQLDRAGVISDIADTPVSAGASGYYTASFPTACTGTNNNGGAAYFQIGNVNSSYGFVRFRATVD
jgi:uncharacterized repeat protein (TIGR01451 family)